MKAYGRKWFVQWVAALVAVVLGMGMCAGLPVSAAYENTYTNTGNQRADIVAVAKTQIGYHEGSLEGTTNSSNNYTKYNVWNGKIEGGYRYAWCHAFVSWCANQAGIGTDIVPKTAGTSTGRSFFVNQGTYRQSAANGGNYVPQAGDIIYYGSGSSPSHVGIVSDCDGSTVYTIEGNYSNKVGTRAINLSNSYIIGYGVPNYKGVNPNPDPPTVSNISIDKALYAVGENVVFHVSSDTATQYTIGIHKNGVPYEILWNFTESSYEYKLTEPGDYYAYLSASNSAGYKDSSGVWFTVYDSKPTTSTLLIPKLNYVAGEPVEFSFTSDTAETFTLGIHRNGVPFDIVYDIKENNYLYTFTEPGDYYAYLCSTNSFGYTNSNGVWFTVYNSAPSISILSTDKHTYSLGENIVFHTESDTATTYSIGLYKDGVRYDSFWDFTENEYMYTSIEPGEYSAYVTSYNSLGYKDSDYIYFTILPSPGDLNSDNTLTTADAVLLQRYLLQECTLTQSQWQTADLNADGTVNGFDLALLRQKLVG
ncbi:dockerin type I domain-containing protein [Ruminococcus callidus]|uniref:dockerin type I domain-containing protein n=1 Tax=Ruminococcus callidus TaxID=40519 RepID=UPI0035227F59